MCTVGIVEGNDHTGAITGYASGTVKISNCYYLNGTASGAVNGSSNTGTIAVNEKVMKALVPTLGDAYMDNIFGVYFNDGFPIFASAAPYVDEGEEFLMGDVNNDGEFNISDALLLQKWLLNVSDVSLSNWETADFCENGRLDSFDLCLMKKTLMEQ